MNPIEIDPPVVLTSRPAGVHRFGMKAAKIVALYVIVASTACGTNEKSSQPASANTQVSSKEITGTNKAEATGNDDGRKSKRRTVAPVDLGEKPGGTVAKSAAEQLDAIRDALKPFQILLGSWNGLSRKALSDKPEWAYDWVSNPKKPSLRMVSEKGPYIREGRLSYLPETDQFEFTAVDADGTGHKYVGTFTEPIRDVVTDEKKPQRTYKLQLTEPEANSESEQWRITFNQQENNRYILELDRKRGNGPFTRVDTVHTQREGTSFALSDTDYGEKTCIISQGLGTISVSYQGQSFWVCCSGCKAAFEEDPAKWIARWEEKKKSMKK